MFISEAIVGVLFKHIVTDQLKVEVLLWIYCILVTYIHFGMGIGQQTTIDPGHAIDVVQGCGNLVLRSRIDMSAEISAEVGIGIVRVLFEAVHIDA